MDTFAYLFGRTEDFQKLFRGEKLQHHHGAVEALLSEVAEVVRADHDVATSIAGRIRARDELAQELADVMVTVVGVALANGITQVELAQALADAVQKNSLKNHATHYLDEDTGRILRKKRFG